MSVCPNCNQRNFPDDIYCGSCGASLAPGRVTAPIPAPTQPIGAGAITCPTCRHINDPGSAFCEMDGAPLAGVPTHTPTPPPLEMTAPPPIVGPVGVLVMPDHSETTLPQTSRVFGRSDLIKYLTSENAKEVSRAHFTITQENGAFYLKDGGPDPKNPQAWKPSINRTSINGVLLEPGVKQKLNPNDVIDVSQLGLNLTFKTR